MEYKDFFEKVNGFLKQAEKHKRRGNNDFNPYLEMWSGSNEVKLHSALICGFLNPLGNHYQGDVFLETFLESVGLKEWFGDTSNARVYKEYFVQTDNQKGRIDIYSTNNDKHIIIENKLEAGDGDTQIEKYIEAIAKEQSLESSELESSDIDSNDDMESSKSKTKQANNAYDNIAVLYLTPDGLEPSGYSLGKWEIQGEYLVNGDNKVKFKAISYKNEILKWIENSQAKVGCITNLNAALLFYKDVVQIITNKKENTMNIAKFLTDNKDNNMQENMEIVFEILENQNEIIESYCEAIIEKHREQIESKGFEIIKTSDNKRRDEWDCNSYRYPYMIKPQDLQQHYFFAFCIEYTKNNENNGYGVRLFGKGSDNNGKIKEYLDIKLNRWWLKRDGGSMQGVESSLQEFLDSTEIKTLNNKLKEPNEKIKSYQAFCDTQDEIEKEIKKDYGEYTIKVYENANATDIWHKDFNEEELGFNISVWYDSKKHKVCFGIYLEHGANTSAMIARLKEVLGVDDSVFHKDSLDPAKQNDIYINLAQYKEVNVADFTKESFINFFESVRKQTDEFNQKIKDDLAKGQNSKLRKFA